MRQRSKPQRGVSGHAYTSMNQGLTIDTYPPEVRPIVPLLRLLVPVLYG